MERIISNDRKLAKMLLIMSAFPLAFALISQYGFALHPCELCIYQRIPYAVAIAFAALAMWKPTLRILVTSAIIIIHCFLIDAGIAFFHVGVEKNWWQSGDCTSNLDMNSIESIKRSLLDAPIVKCNDIQFQLLGVSMAGWNFIYSLAAAIFTIYLLVKYSKFKKQQVQNDGFTV